MPAPKKATGRLVSKAGNSKERHLVARYVAAKDRFQDVEGAQRCAKRRGRVMTADTMT